MPQSGRHRSTKPEVDGCCVMTSSGQSGLLYTERTPMLIKEKVTRTIGGQQYSEFFELRSAKHHARYPTYTTTSGRQADTLPRVWRTAAGTQPAVDNNNCARIDRSRLYHSFRGLTDFEPSDRQDNIMSDPNCNVISDPDGCQVTSDLGGHVSSDPDCHVTSRNETIGATSACVTTSPDILLDGGGGGVASDVKYLD